MATSTITIISGASTVTLDNTVSTITLGTSGPQGTPGEGVPVGGTAGQILAKDSATDYDTSWIDNFTTDVRQTIKNDSGSTLAKGTAVYVSGANGTNVLVKAALANADSTSATTIGLLYQQLANNGSGYVVTEGLLTGIDTSAATAGDPVWLSGTVPGGLLFGWANEPKAPTHIVYLGTVARAHASLGEILVTIRNGWELDELHNVLITSPTNGQVLTYQSSTGLWINSSETGDISAVNVTAPITGGGTSGAVTIGIDQTALAIAPSQVTGTAVITTDPRLSDARTPTAHASTHAAAGSDPVTLAQSQVTNLTTDLAGKAPTTRTISTTAPLAGGGDLSANLTLSIADASTSVKGAVQLTDSTSSTSTTTAATPNSVKTAYDTAAAAVPVSVLRQFLDFDTSTVDTVIRKNAYGSMTPTTNYAYWIMFTPIETITVSSIRMSTQATAAAGTTSCRFGLYTVGTWTGSALPLTLVARTANDTTIFNATYSVFQRSFNTTGGYPATYTLQAGTRYAVGLQMTATTMPIISCVNAHGTTAGQQPIIAMIASGQTDLPATINASTAHYQLMWGRLS